MIFFTNIINYIRNIDIKKYFKKVVPSKENFENLANTFRRKKKHNTRTSDAEYGFTSPHPTTNIHNPTENEEPIYLKVMERKSVVGIVEPTSRMDDAPDNEETDAKISRPSIYTDRTLVGINKLMNHLNDKKHRHTITMPAAELKQQTPKKPKRLSDENEDLKAYILDAINEIEMIRHQIHMKSKIVKTVDCNQADLEFVREYLSSCMMEIEDIDAKGTAEIQSAKEDALYYAKQWFNQLGAQLEKQQVVAEDLYIRLTLAQLDAVKEKLNKLSTEAKANDADNTDVIRRLSIFIDDIEKVDTKAIQKIEAVKRETLQLAEDLTENIHDDIVSKRSELLRNSNETYYNTQIGDEDIYDEVDITSSSENVSIVSSDSESDDASLQVNATDTTQVSVSQFVVPDIIIDSSEVQEVALINTERNRLSVVHSSSILKNKQLKFVAFDLDSSESEISIESNKSDSKNHYEGLTYPNQNQVTKLRARSVSSSTSSSSSSTVRQAKPINTTTSKESPAPKHELKSTPKPPTLKISHQETIPTRLSKDDLAFSYTQECLQEILLCRNRLECLADSVQSFRGTASADEFVFLQDNITFSMMALNAIDSKNIKPVQDMKREAMMYGQIWYDELEQRTKDVAVR